MANHDVMFHIPTGGDANAILSECVAATIHLWDAIGEHGRIEVGDVWHYNGMLCVGLDVVDADDFVRRNFIASCKRIRRAAGIPSAALAFRIYARTKRGWLKRLCWWWYMFRVGP